MIRRRTVLFGLKILCGTLATLTIVFVVVHLFERSSVVSGVENDLTARARALDERLGVLVRARAAWLSSLSPEEIAKESNQVALVGVSKREVPSLWQPISGTDILTEVVERNQPEIEVVVRLHPDSYVVVFLPTRLVLDAMRDVWPGAAGRVYLTNRRGRPVFAWPSKDLRALGPQDAKAKRSTVAFDAVSEAGSHGVDTYRNLDDKDAVGAWRDSRWIHGGIVVEREQRVAFDEILGIQTWHVTGALTVLALMVLLAFLLVPKIRVSGDLFRLYAFTKKYWVLIVLTFLVMGAYATGNMVRLALLKTVFDDVLLTRGPGAIEVLRWIIQVFVVIFLVMAFADWVKEYLIEYVTQATINDIRVAMMAHLMTLDMKFFDRQKAGELMSRLSNDVAQTRQSLSLIFGEFFQQPLMLVGALGAAFITNWRLTLMIFLGLPLIAFPIYKLGRLVNKYSKRRQVQRGVVTEVMLQTVSGVRTVKAFQMENHEGRRLEQASHRLLGQSVRVARTTAMSKTLIDLMNSTGALLILAIGGYMVIYGTAGATAADLMTLSVIIAHMYKPVKAITKTYNRIQEAMAGVDRIFEIMDRKPEIADREGAVDFDRPARRIAFEDVSFAYDEAPVLKGVSFEVRVGEVVAIVGETGSGKSTVTDLVARFYDPTRGRVTIDGRDVKDYRVSSLRRAVATVSQDAFLFNATVRENILYGRPGATDEEIVEAAKSARIHEEILRMDRGYHAEVGERGGRLSGGQRQRITIARAILKDAPILILDEATSALDSETEALVQEALNRLMAGRTTFVVAHRLSTISHADRILVLKDGELVEQGSEEELLAREDGVYRSLYRIQFAGAARNGGA